MIDEDKPKAKKGKFKTRKKVSETYLRNSSLYYLQRHPTSVSHFLTIMDRKMARSLKDHPDQDLEPFRAFLREKLVPDFIRAGFLNDALYADALAGSLRRRGLPRRAIEAKLRQKGLEAPDAPDDHNDLRAAHLYARRKRLGPYATRPRDPQKDLAALARAGFSYDVCKKIMDGTADDDT